MTMPSDLGRQLKKARLELGLTQDALSQACGISQFQISRYESGHITPNPSNLAKLCSSLELPFDQMVRMAL